MSRAMKHISLTGGEAQAVINAATICGLTLEEFLELHLPDCFVWFPPGFIDDSLAERLDEAERIG